MRLFLSDTCYEPLFALPKKIQTKVVNFQKKFRECTTANGMHLEPIAQFNDDSMRTARIDDNYRAVIGLIDNNAYLLYVGTHENAYNWGIRKKLVWNDHTQACQLVTIHQTTETVVNTEPSVTEESYPFSNIPEEKWLKIGVPEDLIKQVMLIKSLDDLEPLEESYDLCNWHLVECLDKDFVRAKAGYLENNESSKISKHVSACILLSSLHLCKKLGKL